MRRKVTRKIMLLLLAVVMCVNLSAEFSVNAEEVNADTVQEGGKTKDETENSSEMSENQKEFMTEEEGISDTKEQKDNGKLEDAWQRGENIDGHGADKQISEMEESQGTSTLSTTKLKNPRIVKDSSMQGGKKVTWDCVWFGSYPYAEVVPSVNNYTAVDKSVLEKGDIIESSSLYDKLQKITGWNVNNTITVDGSKYRRMKMGDATNALMSHDSGFYHWSDSRTYHYFKYEPIKWRVLKVEKDQILLISDKVLDERQYNIEYENTTWENSTIRSWLNGYSSVFNKGGIDYSSNSFINDAFSFDEHLAIASTSLQNGNNIINGTDGGNNTVDQVFLLSESEVYGVNAMPYGFVLARDIDDKARRCRSSVYAKAMGTWHCIDDKYNASCAWWLRSPGYDAMSASTVTMDGCVDIDGCLEITNGSGIRPALNLNLSSNTYTYAGTVCSDGTEDEVRNGNNASNNDNPIVTETDYETEVASFMNNRGTVDTIKYLCKDSNFINSIYVHENDGTFSSNITMILSDVYYRGMDGWKDLFSSSTSKEDAKKILATLLQEYQLDVEELAMAKNAKKYAGYFVKGLEDYITSKSITSSLDKKDINKLSNIITEKKVSELLINGKYETLSAYFQEKGGYSKDSKIVKTLNDYMDSKTLANKLSKGLDFLDDGLTILSLTQDTFNYLYRLESLADADEIYSEMLLYLKNNCCFDVVKDAAAELYDVIHGSYMKQLNYVSTSLKDAVVDKAVDFAISKAVKALPYGEIIKAGFDWGVNISNAIFHIGDTQQLKDSMRTIAYIGNCLSLWVLDNQISYYTSTGYEKNVYARKLYYSLFMLWNTRKVGEETLQSMYRKAYETWSKYYTLSLQISSTLDSFKNTMFTKNMVKSLISISVSCPVDVEIYDAKGKLLAILKDGKESNGHIDDIYYYVRYQKLDNDFVKILSFPEKSEYALKYRGKDFGVVDSVIMNINEKGEPERKYFENVEVCNNTVIAVNSLSSETPVYTVTDALGNKLFKGTFESEPDVYVPATGVMISENKYQITVGSKKFISASVLPKNATEKKMLWNSSDISVAEINSDGVVTAKAVGKCTIQCTAVSDNKICKTIEIEVLQDKSGNQGTGNGTNTENSKNSKISKISISGISKKIAAGKKIKLTASIAPSTATNKALTWQSSNKKVATVNNSGVVTMKKNSGGKSVIITAIAQDGSGVKAKYKITSMKGIVKKISISGKKSVWATKTVKLKAKVKATKKANKKLKWTSSNPNFATVSNSGKVKTYSSGKGEKVKITAMATDGSGKKKTIIIKIK